MQLISVRIIEEYIGEIPPEIRYYLKFIIKKHILKEWRSNMFYKIQESENKIKNYLLKNKIVLFNILISVISLLIRLTLIQFRTSDYNGCLHPWMVAIKQNGGIFALGKQIGDYNIVYQFLIAIGSYIPINDLYLYKGLSILFDFILAAGVGLLVSKLVANNKAIYFSLSYAVILLLPTVLFNSALWAQCDSIYTTFIVFSLVFLLQRKYTCSFIFLGLAFAFKFQTIFILPFYLVLYFVNHKIFIYHYLITILTFWLCGLPAYLEGRSIFSPFSIYMHQAGTYKLLFMHFYNFTGLLGTKANNLMNYEFLAKGLMLLTIAILVIGFMVFITKYSQNPILILGLATWTVYTCVMFLPSIHERYSFMVDILLIILAFSNKKYISISILEILNSFMSYTIYLFANNANVIVFSYISVLIYCYFTFVFFSELFNNTFSKRIIQ